MNFLDANCFAAAVIRDYDFPDVFSYKHFLAALRANNVEFYVLRLGPSEPPWFRVRIAFRFSDFSMIDTAALPCVDPV